MAEESVLLDFCKEEKSIGLGCKAEHSNTVDVGRNVHMNNHRLTGLGTPLETGDALSKGYADNTYCRSELIWMNPAPEEPFAAQTLPLATEGFRFLMVISGFAGISGNGGSAICPLGQIGQNLIHQDGEAAVRNFTSDSAGVHFGDGYRENTLDNRCAVPMMIFGF